MELAYNEQGATNNASLFNGNISAMKWSNSLGLGDVKENAYNYSYDAMNRIKSADFRQKNPAGVYPNTWTKTIKYTLHSLIPKPAINTTLMVTS